MNHRHEEIARAARSFLINYTHASRKTQTERAITALRKATRLEENQTRTPCSLSSLATITWEITSFHWNELDRDMQDLFVNMALQALNTGESFAEKLSEYWYADEEDTPDLIEWEHTCTCGSDAPLKTDHAQDCPIYRYRYL